MMDIYLTVDRLRPGAAFLHTPDKTGILEWRDGRAQPTAAELAAAWAEVQAEQANAEQQRQQQIAARTALRATLGRLAGSTTALTNTQRDQALRDVARALLELGL